MPIIKYSLRKNTNERNPELDQKYGTLIADILIARGITNIDLAKQHIYEDLKNIQDNPFKLNDMEKSIDRIHKAIQNNELITIHADYDCDGIPGACILANLFNVINFKNYNVSIPDRNLEGYGLSLEHVEKIQESNSSLIITIDLGITAIDATDKALQKNIDVIITDHHTVGEKLPNAFSIVHPKLPESSYDNQELCGAGVIYTLVRAFEIKYKDFYNIPANFSYSLVDLAGFATLSDMVLLTVENKVLIKKGLEILRSGKRVGFSALARASRVYLKDLDQGDIAFMLAPKLNVASRMGNPYDAYELLMETDPIKANKKAEMLVALSNERRKLVALMVKEAKREIARSDKDRDNVIVVGNPSWRIGLLGLVASKIVDTYNKPAFVWGRTEHENTPQYKGSCRGNNTINVHTLMSVAPKDTIIEYGGHFEAGGFGIHPDKIYTLHEIMNKAFNLLDKDINTDDIDNGKIMIDAMIPIALLKPALHNAIKQLGPFCPGNNEPIFIFKNVNIVDIRNFGTGNSHIEITFRDNNGQTASTYAFYKSSIDFGNPTIGSIAHIIGTLDSKLWQGSVRMRLKDIIIIG